MKYKDRFDRVLRASHEEIYIFDAITLKFLEVSRGTLENIGYTRDEMLELTPIDIKPMYSEEKFKELIQPLLDGTKELLYFNTIHRRRNGTEYYADVRLQYIPSDVEPVFLALITDITKEKREADELRELAFQDPGTGLYNRRYFTNQLEYALHHVSRSIDTNFGLILIDLDHFSNVNNEHGHIVGDFLMSEVAKRMKDIFTRKDDIVARYGGDEFVILCHNIGPIAFKFKTQQLLEHIRETIQVKDVTLHVTASIGGYHTDNCLIDDTVESLLNKVDKIMYQSKKGGRNKVTIEQDLR